MQIKKLLFICIVIVLVGVTAAFLFSKRRDLITWANRVDFPTSISYTTDHAEDIYKDEILRFAVIADPHIGQNWHGRESSNSRRLKRSIELAVEHKAEFFVALGDLTQTGSKQEFEELKKILDAGHLRYFTAIGNHDVFQNQNYYTNYFGPKFAEIRYTLQKKVPDTYAPVDPIATLYFFDMSQMESEYGDILGKEQTLWLKDKMTQTMGEKNSVILAFSGQGLQPLRNDNEDQLALFLCESNIVAFIHGGPHRFSTKEESCYFEWMYKRDSRITTIHTVSPGTIGEYSPERSAQVSIIHVFPDFRYEIERIPIGVNPVYPDYSDTQ